MAKEILKDLLFKADSGLHVVNFDLKFKNSTFPASLVISDYSEEYIDNNIKDLISKSDYELSKSLPTKERRKSFILGRITALESIMNIDPSLSSKDISIRWGVLGQPIVICQSPEDIQISISHSHDIAASLAFYKDCPMAIDIEKICPIRAKSVISQLSQFETVNLVTNDIDLITLWTAKESLSKRFETGITADFSLYEVSKMDKKDGYIESYFKNFSQYKIFSYLINGYIYSILLPKDVEIYLR